MDRKELIKKYTDLSRTSDIRTTALHGDLRVARAAKNENNSGWKELADYEVAIAEHLAQKRVSQIFGRICHDLGDA